MKKFILGLITGIAIMLIADFLFIGFFTSNKNNTPNIVSSQSLIEGAQKFGSLNVVITAGKTAFVSGIEVDVGEYPGGKMAVEITDKNGTAFFDKMPVGNFVIFFNDATFPKNFERVSSLIPVKIVEGQTTEQKIELNELK
ncbi:MAG: hypothetical protein GX428_09400 [Candidatus Atribacteria bacterium]|nr:hypothetical protein [Candidatus Atribacteria bacterium]